MSHLSTLTLHRLRYGELDPNDLAVARGHLDGCPRCSGRLRVQTQDRAQFVLKPIPDEIRRLGGVPAEPWWRPLFAWRGVGLASGLVVAAAVLLAFGLQWNPGGPGLDDVIVYKGVLPEVEAWVDLGDGPRLLREDDTLGAGDRVQLKYDPHGASYVALAGRDKTGVIEVYSTEAPTGIGLVNAPFALTLDDAAGQQELFVVGSDLPLEDDQVKEAITNGVLDGRVRVRRVVIQKEAHP